MDFVNRMAGRRPMDLNVDGLFKMTPLSPSVQHHLKKVYVTLAAAMLLAAAGVYVSLAAGLGGIFGVLGFVGCTTWLAMTPPLYNNLNKRYALLGGAAFSQGLTVAPLVGVVLELHPAMVLTAFLGTSAVFLCFSAAALMSKRRSFLYLGATLSSAITTFMMMRLATWMFGGRALAFQAELYLGLLVFVGYVLFDTQVIVEKAYQGNADHISAALSLFVDFAAIFVRILVILMKNAEKREDRKSSRKSRQ